MMQKISISIRLIIFSLVISVTTTAQKIEFYTYKNPVNILSGGGKICVKNLTNNGTVEADFGAVYAKSIVKALKDEGIGKVSNVKLYNTWLTTKLYDIVDSESDADYIISGDYKFGSSGSNSYEEKWIKETSPTVEKKLPICYYKFTASSSASLEGKLVVSKKDGSLIGTLPFGDTKSKNQTTAIEKPSVPNASSFIKTLSDEAINKNMYAFSPWFVVEKYKFKNVKTKNKEFKKELSNIENQIETLVKTGEINEAGKKYIEIEDKEESEETSCNIAICYELIGNFTKAKEYYIKAADKSGIERINQMIVVRDTLQKLGIKTVENEL